jgi:hypothetical protein
MITKGLLQELEMEMPNTRKSLERFRDKFDWAPHKKSMTVGRLVAASRRASDWALRRLSLDTGYGAGRLSARSARLRRAESGS